MDEVLRGLINHARNTPGEMWEFECNEVGPEFGAMPRISYVQSMYDELLGLIGKDWVGVYSLYDHPFPSHQTRKMIKDLEEAGKVETKMVVKMRKTKMVRRIN